ncbi:hypothetical protein PGTUg99_029013 [Puccinia graminis f. sp. tritici]|uniref:HIT-type domain-containing protein n=1 Tax=Puccinia graminis f. sp. tritici TaxID=56615 RepID=A0A5B0S5E9_PUCGR|nr:hypothetical protein PGTUg99_029013 [Puccinia graminis f. sp. tritici]
MFGRGSFPRRKSKTVMDSPLLQPLRPAGKRRRRINLANQDTIKCFICQEKFAKYTCPSCNLRYCSVDCFKSQSHSACSESFYKNALLEDFQLEDGSFNGRPQSSQATAMLEILRKIESGQPFSDEDEESADAGSVDLTEEQLNRLSKDELLGFLTQDQIEEFDRKVSTGELDPDFIQATINAQCEDPWWIERQTELPESNPPPPKIHLVQQSLLPALPDRLNPHLFYHLFSLTLGYVSLLRYYGLRSLCEAKDEDRAALPADLPHFFPILFQTELRLESIAECFGEYLKNLPTMEAESIRFLLQDLRSLFPASPSKSKKNKLIIEMEASDQEEAVPSPRCALALSDLYHFLNTHHDWRNIYMNVSRTSVLKKLLFFISFSMEPSRLERFPQEVDQDHDLLDSHLKSDDNTQLLPNQPPFSNLLLSNNTHPSDLAPKPPKIIETSTTDDTV